MTYSCPVCGKEFATELPAARHVIHTSDPDHADWRATHDLEEVDSPVTTAVDDLWER